MQVGCNFFFNTQDNDIPIVAIDFDGTDMSEEQIHENATKAIQIVFRKLREEARDVVEHLDINTRFASINEETKQVQVACELYCMEKRSVNKVEMSPPYHMRPDTQKKLIAVSQRVLETFN